MRRLLLAGIVGCLGLGACGGGTTPPPVMNEEQLVAHLLPRGDERLVVANFWASW
jgi:hypothetical protein